MQSNGTPKIRGWIFDVYPGNIGEMAVWIIAENGKRVRLTDRFQPKINVSGKKENVEKLHCRDFFSLSLVSMKQDLFTYLKTCVNYH
jgi:hypothetical protein